MAREDRFNFRLDSGDRRRLEAIALWLERSQGDALRWLIRQAHRELEAGLERPGERQGGHHVPQAR
jgi:hypothetical protein